MSSFDFTLLCKVPMSNKHLIYGFIRSITKLISSNINTKHPSLVIAICILYHYHDQERFTSFGSQITSDRTCNFISINSDVVKNTAYGNVVVNNKPNSIYRWIFKIIKLDQNGRICIGIDSSNRSCVDSDFRSQFTVNGTFYGTTSDAVLFGDGVNRGYAGYTKDDVIEMRLNTKQNVLTFLTKRQTASIKKINFNHHYNLAVSLFGSACVQLMYFDQQIISNIKHNEPLYQEMDLDDLLKDISMN